MKPIPLLLTLLSWPLCQAGQSLRGLAPEEPSPPPPPPHRRGTTKLFAQNIGHLVDTRLDPLVKPNDCSGHVHSVLGNAKFGSFVWKRDFLDSDWQDTTGKENRTTSELVPNLSSYWAPSLYVWHNETQTYHLVPSFARTYYRIEHLRHDDESRLTVNPYPDFLMLIAGDARRRNYWRDDETDRDDIRWTLTTQNRKATDYLENGDWSYLDFDTFTNYARGQLEMNLRFPNCLAVKKNGRPATRSPNFRDHASYATSETWDPVRGWCPPEHPYPIPRLDLEMRYDLSVLRKTLGAEVADNPANWVLSTGDTTGAGAHADFVSGWPKELLANTIANCTDGEHASATQDCWLDGMDLDGRSARGKSVPYNEDIPNEAVHAVAALPGSRGEGCPEMVPATEVPW